jgi:hypothetical protein
MLVPPGVLRASGLAPEQVKQLLCVLGRALLRALASDGGEGGNRWALFCRAGEVVEELVSRLLNAPERVEGGVDEVLECFVQVLHEPSLPRPLVLEEDRRMRVEAVRHWALAAVRLSAWRCERGGDAGMAALLQEVDAQLRGAGEGPQSHQWGVESIVGALGPVLMACLMGPESVVGVEELGKALRRKDGQGAGRTPSDRSEGARKRQGQATAGPAKKAKRAA